MTSDLSLCPVARAADLIGDRWSLLVMRTLVRDGPQRYQNLADALPGISPTTLSARLKSLQDKGLITRTVTDTHPPGTHYEVTTLGEQARPIIRAYRAFGAMMLEGD